MYVSPKLSLEEFTEIFNKLRDNCTPYQLHYDNEDNGSLMIWVPPPSYIFRRHSWESFNCAKYYLGKRKITLSFIQEYFKLKPMRETIKTKVFLDNKQRIITVYCIYDTI